MTSPIALLAAVAVSAAAPAFPAPDRPVASIVAPAWSSPDSRDAAGESRSVIEGMGIRRGMTVADIGAGSGYHTVRLSPVVGPRGKIYAQDVQADYLAELKAEVARRRLSNVELVVGAPDDPRLPPASVDRAILIHMYHEIAQPYGLLWNLVPALKPGARVGVVDLDSAIQRHGTPPALLRCEFEAVGYRQVAFRKLNQGYLAVFAAPARRPEPAAIKPCSGG